VFEKWKARRAQRVAEAAARELAQREATWEHTDQQLIGLIARAKAAASGTFPPVDSSVPLKAGEHALLDLAGVSLIEPRRGPGHWQGASQGVSVDIPGTKSMRYRVGATRGTFVQGEENPAPIDTGTLTITDRRAVFVGSQQTREWAWSKLVGFHDDNVGAWTGIAVSNRQKISGVAYPPGEAQSVWLSLELAAALGNGTVDSFVADLETERVEWAANRPASAPTCAPPPIASQPRQEN
jgi:ABC-type amino acid transport substrate-binding protein